MRRKSMGYTRVDYYFKTGDGGKWDILPEGLGMPTADVEGWLEAAPRILEW